MTESDRKDREAARVVQGGIPQHPSVFGIGPAILCKAANGTDTEGVILHGLRTRSLCGDLLERNDDVKGYPIPVANLPRTTNDAVNYWEGVPDEDIGIIGYLVGNDFDDIWTHEANRRMTPFIIGKLVDETQARQALGQYEYIVKRARLDAWIRTHREILTDDGPAQPDPGPNELLLTNWMRLSFEDGRVVDVPNDYGKSYFAAGDHCIERTKYLGGRTRTARVNVSPEQFRRALVFKNDTGWNSGGVYNGNASTNDKPEPPTKAARQNLYVTDHYDLPGGTDNTLAAPERFPGDMSGDATTSKSVEQVFNRSDSSWINPPRATDLEAALQGKGTRSKRRFILSTYVTEATFEEIAAAEREHAFTWRRLVTALHRDGITRRVKFTEINRLATR